VVDNGWAISMPRSGQTATPTLAQKALSAGLPSERVDGNDVIAVADAAARALARARGGGGATLIEAVTYRLSDHTTADDARRYRDEADVSRRSEAEPLVRLRRHLEAAGAWGREDEERLLAESGAAAEAAAQEFLATAPEPPEAMFDHLHEWLPAALAHQRRAAARKGRAGA
jgi:pyruvate dehydrogenase E1 component alpha subunit